MNLTVPAACTAFPPSYFCKGWSSVWSLLCQNSGVASRWIRWHVWEAPGVCWQECVAATSGPSWGNVSYLDCKL